MTRGPNPNFDGGNPDTQAFYWHAGFDGFTTGLLLNQVNGVADTLFSKYNATVLLLHAGTNDPQGTPDTTVANLVAIANAFLAVHDSNAKVFVMKTINAGSDSSNNSLNAFVATLGPKIATAFSGKAQCTVVNPPFIPDGDFLGGSIGIHPLDSGYALMVDDGSGNGWKPALVAAGF